MKVIIISSLGNKQLLKCLQSLLLTAKSQDFDIQVIREKTFREVTLNQALRDNKNDDLLLVGDDITFTNGWLETLKKRYSKADVFGFSTLYENDTVVQDRGYDLCNVDGRIILQASDRGADSAEIKPFDLRYCDTVCGCLLFVKKKVLKSIDRFSLDGQNRWGEFIFTHQARKKGYKVAVLGHYVYHQGQSTKVNPKKQYSTTSYSYEKTLWDKIVDKHVDKSRISAVVAHHVSDQLERTIQNAENVLLYGAGTVAEFLLRRFDNKKIAVISGLREEDGLSLNGKKVRHYQNITFEKYDVLLITVLGYGKEIYENTLKEKVDDYGIAVAEIYEKRSDKRILFDLRFLNSPSSSHKRSKF